MQTMPADPTYTETGHAEHDLKGIMHNRAVLHQWIRK